MTSAQTPVLPIHIETTVQTLAKLHAEHRNRASPLQRSVEIATAKGGSAGSPGHPGGAHRLLDWCKSAFNRHRAAVPSTRRRSHGSRAGSVWRRFA
jgi:hypothetical protein